MAQRVLSGVPRILLLAILFVPAFAQDARRDLLVRFAPSFLIAENDCAGMPAEFVANSREPTVAAKNGSIYGQVIAASEAGRPGAFLELHYYHLWSKDCGRMGHPLDAEHVAVLVRADQASLAAAAWKAVYWFAAAHEDTICDNSHAFPAAALDAVSRGATVWISKDKHASFLKQELCEGGCGRDRCDRMKPLAAGQLIVLDRRAAWVGSAQWPLDARMNANFSPALVAELDRAAGAPVFSNPSRPGVKATVRVSDTTASAMLLGPQHTESGLETAADKTEDALQTSVHAVGKSLGRAGRATGAFLHRK